MRNALLYLAIPLIVLYLVGGSEALIDALAKVVVLSGVQLITRYLDRPSIAERSLNRSERRRLKNRQIHRSSNRRAAPSTPVSTKNDVEKERH